MLSSVITASRGIDSLRRLPLFAAWTASTAIRYVTLWGTQARRSLGPLNRLALGPKLEHATYPQKFPNETPNDRA